jgi:hypothetical protein
VHVPSPVHPAPLHPAKREPVPGVALRVTDVEAGNVALHALPQAIPAGAEATVPDPAPERTTVSVAVVETATTVVAAGEAQPFTVAVTE